MGANKARLTPEEESLMHLIPWMENTTYLGKVYVLDVNFDTGSVVLYGDNNDTTQFRQEMNNIMADIYAQVPPWRDW